MKHTDQVAYVFNRTALGLGVLLGLYHASQSNWRGVAMVLVMIGVYFWLHRTMDAP